MSLELVFVEMRDQLNEQINGEMDKWLGELIQSKEPDSFPEVNTKK